MRKKRTSHGADICGFAAKNNRSEESVRDFSSSLNPLGIPASVTAVYYESLLAIARYPDRDAAELCRELAARHGLLPAHVLAGNGAVALLELAIRVVKPARVLLVEPCFSEYRRLLEIHGAKVTSLALQENEEFQFSASRIRQMMSGHDLVVLGHPNNPTGTALDRAELLSLVGSAQRAGIIFLVDEAFCDWCPELSIAAETRRLPNLIVVRSLTKFFSLAGIRSGFVLASRKRIETMRALQETWSCNALAQRLSIVALHDLGYQQRSLDWLHQESARFVGKLAKIKGLKVYPSRANFFLIQLTSPRQQTAFCKALAAEGFYLRGPEGFRGLNKNFFRIALRLKSDNDLLLKIMQTTLAAASKVSSFEFRAL